MTLTPTTRPRKCDHAVMDKSIIDDPHLSSGDIRGHLHYLHQGQLRPYADSEWRAEIRIEQFTNGRWHPVEWDEEKGKPFTHLVRLWKYEGPPSDRPFGECFAPHLTSFKKIRDGVWAATITKLYTD
ncbi:MAG: hypothetical protein JWO80_82 [Bryobacterales bacterium]|nr:hypothetical protein [Bryobacterales bacterium]